MEEGNPKTGKEPPKELLQTKTVVVIKRRNLGAKYRLQTNANASRGIPKPGLLTELPERVPKVPKDQNDDSFETILDDSVIGSLPSDAFMVIQALQSNHETSIMIPLLHSSHNEPFLKAVLECQVHNRLRDSSSSSELQELLDSRDPNGSLVQLRDPSNDGMEAVLSVLLTTKDYVRGVHDAMERHRMNITEDNSSSFKQTVAIVDWFVKHVRDWPARYIRDSDVEESFHRDPLVGFRGHKQVMTVLQTLQVVLPSHELHAYQLWLPEWGTVLKSWQEVRGKILANIKRSYHGEKSLKSLKQSASPIPIELIIEWLKEVGVVYGVNRPSGVFIRLC